MRATARCTDMCITSMSELWRAVQHFRALPVNKTTGVRRGLEYPLEEVRCQAVLPVRCFAGLRRKNCRRGGR